MTTHTCPYCTYNRSWAIRRLKRKCQQCRREWNEWCVSSIGGQRKNKHLHIRRIQGKRGHGTDKLPIVGICSRSSGEVYNEKEKLLLALVVANEFSGRS